MRKWLDWPRQEAPAVAIVRHVVVLLTGFIAGGRTVDAVRAWREWHRLGASDASAAAAYRAFCLIDSAAAVVSLVIAALVWWLLRERTVSSRLP
jgi:hypothetical protein